MADSSSPYNASVVPMIEEQVARRERTLSPLGGRLLEARRHIELKKAALLSWMTVSLIGKRLSAAAESTTLEPRMPSIVVLPEISIRILRMRFRPRLELSWDGREEPRNLLAQTILAAGRA